MSQLHSVNLKDIGKAFLMTSLVTFCGTVTSAASTGAMPTSSQLGQWALGGLVAGCMYLVKNFFTNSNNQLLSSETTKVKVEGDVVAK